MYIHAYPEGSKVSRYDALTQVQKTTGKLPNELKESPSLGLEAEHAWGVYTSLSEHTFTELQNYINLTGDELLPWEVKAIVKLAKYREVTPSWPLK